MLLFVGWALVRTVLRLVTLWHRHHVRTDVPVFLTCVALTLLTGKNTAKRIGTTAWAQVPTLRYRR